MDDIKEKLIEIGLSEEEAKAFVEKYPDHEWCEYFLSEVLASSFCDKTDICRTTLHHTGKCPMRKYQRKKAKANKRYTEPMVSHNQQLRSLHYQKASKDWDALAKEYKTKYFNGLADYDEHTANFIAKGRYCAEYADRQTIPQN